MLVKERNDCSGDGEIDCIIRGLNNPNLDWFPAKESVRKGSESRDSNAETEADESAVHNIKAHAVFLKWSDYDSQSECLNQDSNDCSPEKNYWLILLSG